MPWFSFRSASSRHKELLDPDTGTATQRSGPPKDSPKEVAREAKELRVSCEQLLYVIM